MTILTKLKKLALLPFDFQKINFLVSRVIIFLLDVSLNTLNFLLLQLMPDSLILKPALRPE